MMERFDSTIEVSVIIPLYKGKTYVEKLKPMLEKNARNLFECKHQKIEVIFVNDYPEEIIEGVKIAGVEVVCLNSKVNQGIHGARVLGYQVAKGRYIVFLDQDDSIDEMHLVSQLDAIKDGNAVLSNGIYRENRVIYDTLEKQKQTTCLWEYISCPTTIISPGQVMLRRECIPEMWLTNIMQNNGIDDCFLWILLMKNGVEFKVNPAVIYRHNENDGNTSFDWKKMNLSRNEMLALLKKLDVLSDEEYQTLENSMNWSTYKAECYIRLDELWDEIESRKISLADYMCNKGYYNIAIYGMGVYGLKLYHLLEGSKVRISYGIDKSASAITCDLQIVSREDTLEKVDLIVNSATFANESVKAYLHGRTCVAVLGLDELLEGVVRVECGNI